MGLILNGIGRSKLIISGASRTTTVILPLTAQDGYEENWVDVCNTHVIMNPDTSDPYLEEKDFLTGSWGVWDLSWAGIPLSIADANLVTDVANARGLNGNNASMEFFPKKDYGRSFFVKIVPGTWKFKTYDTDLTKGVFGLAMQIKTIRTHKLIVTLDPNSITYSGESLQPISGARLT